MELKEMDSVYIQSFKHDGSLHRTWAKGTILEHTEKRTVLITNKTVVTEADGRTWITREPAICFFYPDKWYNVISMIRKTGVHYYCNIASPSLYDGEAIKNIDYDLDVKVMPNGTYHILDEDEYALHRQQLHYDATLHDVIQAALKRVLTDVQLKNSPFSSKEVLCFYDKYLSFLKTNS